MFTSNTEFFNFKKLIYTSDSLLAQINLDKKKKEKNGNLSFEVVSLSFLFSPKRFI